MVEYRVADQFDKWIFDKVLNAAMPAFTSFIDVDKLDKLSNTRTKRKFEFDTEKLEGWYTTTAGGIMHKGDPDFEQAQLENKIAEPLEGATGLIQHLVNVHRGQMLESYNPFDQKLKNILLKPTDELIAMLQGFIDKGEGPCRQESLTSIRKQQQKSIGFSQCGAVDVGEDSVPHTAPATPATPRGQYPKRKRPSVDTCARGGKSSKRPNRGKATLMSAKFPGLDEDDEEPMLGAGQEDAGPKLKEEKGKGKDVW